MFEREYRELSFVPRWSILRNIRQQSVAEHSYYTALYAGQIADLIAWVGDRGELYKAALLHDLEEGGLGDWPGPAKRQLFSRSDDAGTVSNEIGEDYKAAVFDSWAEIDVPRDIELIIKVADMLDAVIFLLTDKQLGNRTIGSIHDINTVTPASQLYANLKNSWSKLTQHMGMTATEADNVFRQHIYVGVDDAENKNSYIIRNS